MKILILSIGLISASTAMGSNYKTQCKINNGRALAWIEASDKDIYGSTETVLTVFDTRGDKILKKKQTHVISIDAFDRKKVFSRNIGSSAAWCRLKLKNNNFSSTHLQPTTTIHHFHRAPRQRVHIIHHHHGSRSTLRPRARQTRQHVTLRPKSRRTTTVHVKLPRFRVHL